MKTISLTKGMNAKVDDEDFDKLNQHKWFAHNRRGKYYAARGARRGNRIVMISMHRVVMGATSGQKIDHINSDPLDNQKKNLRFATITENNWNAKVRKDNKSGHKGVSKYKDTSKWRAYIQVNNNWIHLGYYNTSCEAAKVYNKAAKKYYGEFAKLNKI